MPHLRVTGFHIDMNIALLQHLRGSWSDRSDYSPVQTLTKRIDKVELFSHPQHVHHLMSAGQQKNISLTCSEGPYILFQRFCVFREIPAINPNCFNRCPTRFQTCYQRCIGDTIFLQTDHLIGNRNLGINGLQQFPPGVGFRDAMGRLDPNLLQSCGWLGPSTDGHHVGKRIKKTLSVNMFFH